MSLGFESSMDVGFTNATVKSATWAAHIASEYAYTSTRSSLPYTTGHSSAEGIPSFEGTWQATRIETINMEEHSDTAGRIISIAQVFLARGTFMLLCSPGHLTRGSSQ
jgi:hypothetical protein